MPERRLMSDSTHPIRTRSLTAAILAGGRSSRMGQDKALLRLTPDGPTLLESTIETLNRIADRVIVIAPLDRGYQSFGVAVVPDAFPGAGALGGIATGLRASASSDLFVVACDHPFLSEPLIRHLAAVEGDFDAVAPRTAGSSRQGGDLVVQTLHALYRPSCLTTLERVIDEGYESSMDFFRKINLRTIDEPELRLHDADLRSLMSVNTPIALDCARAMAKEPANLNQRLDYTHQSE